MGKSLREVYAGTVIAETTINGLELMALSRLDPSGDYDDNGQTVGQRLAHLEKNNKMYDELTTTLLRLDFTGMPPEVRAGFLDRYDRLGEMQAVQWLASRQTDD